MISERSILIGVLFLAFGAGPAAAQTFVYGAKGQSPEQQAKDEGECFTWARQQTGFDPTQAHAGGQIYQEPQQGGVGRGATRGAVTGLAVGAIAGDAGRGAAIGAVGGGLVGGMRRRDQEERQRQAQQQQQAQLSQQQANFNRAYAVCLEGRGYTVR